MRYLIMLEETDSGFAVQVPDLAISTAGETVDGAKQAAVKAIQTNLEAYREEEMQVPTRAPVKTYLDNPDFDGLLYRFTDGPVRRSASRVCRRRLLSLRMATARAFFWPTSTTSRFPLVTAV